jgi:translation initiation factor 2 subunit 2
MDSVVEECDNDLAGKLLLDLPLKKKKKPKQLTSIFDTSSIPSEQESASSKKFHECKNTNTYTYEFLLNRVQEKLKDDNPSLTGILTKAKLQPLDVHKDGVRRTLVSNFMPLCKELNRDPNHMMAYILSELSVAGNLDGTERLVLRGRFSPSALGSVARKYVSEYVICHACKKIDTIIIKDKRNRLHVLHCDTCHATRTISAIVQGFRAKL